MHLSSPEKSKTPDKKRILLLGPPGGRKTSFAMSFPNVCFFDIDGNLDGPKLALSKLLKTEPTFGYESIFLDERGKRLDDYECFDNLLLQIKALKSEVKAGKSPFKFACFDGLRALGDLIKAHILHKQSNKTAMDTRDWDPYKQAMLKVVFFEAQNLAMHTIFTCHERELWEKDPTGKGDMMKERLVGYEPLLQGGIQQAFGGYFSDVYRVTTELAPGDQIETKIQCIKDGKSPDLKSSVGMPPVITLKQGETAWSKLEPYFKDCL